MKRCIDKGEVATGLLYLEEDSAAEMHTLNKTVARPLVDLPFAELCPENAKLQASMGE